MASGKESTSNAGDRGSISGLGRFPGEENDNQLQYSCLENSTDRGAWWATVHGGQRDTTESWWGVLDSNEWLTLKYIKALKRFWTSLVAQMVKASAYNVGDWGWIPGLGRSPGVGSHSSTLALKIPWTEDPGRLQSMGSQRVGHNWMLSLSLPGPFGEEWIL